MSNVSRSITRRSVQVLSPIIAAAIAIAIFVAPASAQQLTGTLKKIKDTGTFTLGYRESSIPFAYYDQKQQPVGYSMDFSYKVVEALKKDNPNLKVNLIPITSQNRITLVQNGTIDMECGSTTNNKARQQQVAFSDSIFVIGTRLLTRKDSGIKDFPDLAHKTVVVSAGTTSEPLIRIMNEEKHMGMNIISAKDHGESFLILETGRAAAFMVDDVLLAGERMKAKHPDDWVIVGTPQSREAYGCMMRKDDPQFQQYVDKVFSKVMTSGEAERIYKKWFQSPVPPKGLNMNLALSPELAADYKHPNDTPYQ
jgi:glutamate/aspartate transport system substrate-binding protein